MPDTGNPWIDHYASFRRADMLRAAQKAAADGSFPSAKDQQEIIRLAIAAHDCMSILGGGELIEVGTLAQAVFRLRSGDSANP